MRCCKHLPYPCLTSVAYILFMCVLSLSALCYFTFAFSILLYIGGIQSATVCLVNISIYSQVFFLGKFICLQSYVILLFRILFANLFLVMLQALSFYPFISSKIDKFLDIFVLIMSEIFKFQIHLIIISKFFFGKCINLRIIQFINCLL